MKRLKATESEEGKMMADRWTIGAVEASDYDSSSSLARLDVFCTTSSEILVNGAPNALIQVSIFQFINFYYNFLLNPFLLMLMNCSLVSRKWQCLLFITIIIVYYFRKLHTKNWSSI